MEGYAHIFERDRIFFVGPKWDDDAGYGVVLLLGAGNSFILVTGMSMQARLVGKNR